jgi:hypothetical protein
MKLKNSVIFNAYRILGKIAGQELGISTAYKLKTLIKKIEPTFVTIDEVRNDVIKKLGEKEGEQLVLKSKEGFEQITQLLNEETDVEFEKITFKSSDDIKLSAIDLINLEEFVVIDESK